MHSTDKLSVNGQQIPILLDLSGQESLAVVITHGFGGSRNSRSGQKSVQRLTQHGIGAVRFDLPGHGDNPLPLSISNCLDTIAAVETILHRSAPQAEIAYFSSSFGGYLNLLYCSTRSHLGHHSLLRCAAVNMPTLLPASLSPLDHKVLQLTGCVPLTLEGAENGILLSRQFLEELKQNDVFSKFSPTPSDRFYMIHGATDRVVPSAAVQEFAQKFHLPLTILPNAGHQFCNPGEMEQLLDIAISFFLK